MSKWCRVLPLAMLFAFLLGLPAAAQAPMPASIPNSLPSWAYNIPDKDQPPPARVTGTIRVPGSKSIANRALGRVSGVSVAAPGVAKATICQASLLRPTEPVAAGRCRPGLGSREAPAKCPRLGSPHFFSPQRRKDAKQGFFVVLCVFASLR